MTIIKQSFQMMQPIIITAHMIIIVNTAERLVTTVHTINVTWPNDLLKLSLFGKNPFKH